MVQEKDALLRQEKCRRRNLNHCHEYRPFYSFPYFKNSSANLYSSHNQITLYSPYAFLHSFIHLIYDCSVQLDSHQQDTFSAPSLRHYVPQNPKKQRDRSKMTNNLYFYDPSMLKRNYSE